MIAARRSRQPGLGGLQPVVGHDPGVFAVAVFATFGMSELASLLVSRLRCDAITCVRSRKLIPSSAAADRPAAPAGEGRTGISPVLSQRTSKQAKMRFSNRRSGHGQPRPCPRPRKYISGEVGGRLRRRSRNPLYRTGSVTGQEQRRRRVRHGIDHRRHLRTLGRS